MPDFESRARAAQHHRLAAGPLTEADFCAGVTASRRAMCGAVRGLVARQDVEDVVADAVLRGWAFRASFNPERASIKTWLMAIARNAAFESLRRRGIVSADEKPTEAPDPEPTPEAAVLRAEVRSLINAGAERLTSCERRAFKAWLEGRRLDPNTMRMIPRIARTVAASARRKLGLQ